MTLHDLLHTKIQIPKLDMRGWSGFVAIGACLYLASIFVNALYSLAMLLAVLALFAAIVALVYKLMQYPVSSQSRRVIYIEEEYVQPTTLYVEHVHHHYISRWELVQYLGQEERQPKYQVVDSSPAKKALPASSYRLLN